MADSKNLYQRLAEVQRTAHAPREIRGKFGQARSAEQVLEAYKPICNDNGLYLYTTDELVQIGDRNYVKATATVVDIDTQDSHSASAYAWENVVEKSSSGNAILDTSQVTGKTSSYAKKYALQNLFAIDDTKDADQDEAPKAQAPAAKTPQQPVKEVFDQPAPATGSGATPKQLAFIQSNFSTMNIDERDDKLAYVKKIIGRDISSSTELTKAEAKKVIDQQLGQIEGE